MHQTGEQAERRDLFPLCGEAADFGVIVYRRESRHGQIAHIHFNYYAKISCGRNLAAPFGRAAWMREAGGWVSHNPRSSEKERKELLAELARMLSNPYL
jgi:hypothetical protein